MERAEIDYFVDFLAAKQKQLEAIESEVRNTLPARDKVKRDVGTFYEWPIEQQLALTGEDLTHSLKCMVEDIESEIRRLEKAEADDERVPVHCHKYSSRYAAYEEQRLGGAA